MKKNILVTGGAGFIGSNFIEYYTANYPDHMIVNIDKLTYAGDLNNLFDVENRENYKFVQGDICDKKLIQKLFVTYQFKGVFHFAAESHVDNSIEGPEAFIKTNIEGTFVLLDAARDMWLTEPGKVKDEFKDARFLHVSTDEVYGTLYNFLYNNKSIDIVKINNFVSR